jgi:hypothetical protein
MAFQLLHVNTIVLILTQAGMSTCDHSNVIVMLWGAHCNIQRIYAAVWSRYVLKYALKCEPTGHLAFSRANLKRLGYDDESKHQILLASLLLSQQPLGPSEAALACLDIPIISADCDVKYVSSALPKQRTL